MPIFSYTNYFTVLYTTGLLVWQKIRFHSGPIEYFWNNLFQKSAVRKMSTNEDEVSLLFEMLIPDEIME